MGHRIYAGDEREARALAGMFAGEGFSVRYDRGWDGDFVLLEVRETHVHDPLRSLRG